MSYQSNLAKEYALLLSKVGSNPSTKQKKELDKLLKLLRKTV